LTTECIDIEGKNLLFNILHLGSDGSRDILERLTSWRDEKDEGN